DGNVVVRADRQGQIATIAGADTSGKTAGVGIAVSAVFQVVETDALVSGNASILARGSRGTTTVPTGRDSMRAPVTSGIRGISITAMAAEQVSPVSTSAAKATGGGVAGAVNHVVEVATTQASIGPGAALEQFQTGSADAAQRVNVLADSTTSLFGLAGEVAAGSTAGGFGAGIDASSVIKTTVASVAGQVSANTDVTIQAISTENVISITGTKNDAGGGTAAIAGSAGIHLLK